MSKMSGGLLGTVKGAMMMVCALVTGKDAGERRMGWA